MHRFVLAAAALVVLATPLDAQPQSKAEMVPAIPRGGDIPKHFTPLHDAFDYIRREAMIPMRDGVKLHAVLIIPRGVSRAPIMLDRTPYSADEATKSKHGGTVVEDIFRPAYAELARAGYIVAFEDVRGKYGSGGEYVMNRPLRGPLNATRVDHATDAYDTIDWLVKHVPESNGRVGTIGTSYDGFTTLMSLINPHPALKAAVPINPMVDVWKGDDWFHNGAFRQEMISYVYSQTATKQSDADWFTGAYDDYTTYLRYGSADTYARAMGMEQLPFWTRLTQHPAYDQYWQDQAVDRLLARQGLTVPTLLVDSMWDQEDIYGAPATFAALKGRDNGNLFLGIGPWHHGQVNIAGSKLGALEFDGDTSKWFRANVLLPFLDSHLKDGAPAATIAKVTAYETGSNVWRRYDDWPLACASNCPATLRPLYLSPAARLSFSPAAGQAYDEYISDPAKPVTYRARPNSSPYADGSTWRQWLVDDQRFAEARPDVLAYSSEVLTAPLRIAGSPVAHLLASTSGTDSDWVVKLIDVYPAQVPDKPELGGYELAVSMDVLRGRYRDDPARPTAIPAGQPVNYTLDLPTVDHVFLPGHRIMVQIQSSWFPLYDRNPQRFVPNIFFARPDDYVKATQRVFSGPQGSYVALPVAP